MDYEFLPVLYYKDEEKYNHTLASRRGGEYTVKLPVKIHGEQAFYCCTPQLLEQTEHIYRLNGSIFSLWDGIPAKSKDRYFSKALIAEIMGSNKIEGVRSSKQELRAAFDAVSGKSNKPTSFTGIVDGYYRILLPGKISVEQVSDIRMLYDVVILPNLNPADAPDGRLFRKSGVSVVTATEKEKHHGILPEADLIRFLTLSLEYLQATGYSLAAVSAFHYLFGYAHPFYDGNGRMARFLSSAFLRESLHPLIGLHISQGIANNRKAYYDAFDVCNNVRAKGDITPFILYYLSVIAQSTEGLQKDLESANAKLKHYSEAFHKTLGKEDDEITRGVLAALLEVTVFSDVGISVGGIGRYAEACDSTVYKRLQKLAALGVPITTQKDGKKNLYRLDLAQ